MRKKTPVKNRLHSNAKQGYQVIFDHLIPHAGNSYKPHALRHRVLMGYSVILILFKVLVVLAPLSLPSSSLFSSSITPANIISLTNQERKNFGLKGLKKNAALTDAANAKARDMLAHSYFAHNSPDGKTPWDWIKASGYHYLKAGENLAVNFHTAEDVDSGWMASASHRANIINPGYTEIGVGTATGEYEGVSATFVVQMFGDPATTLAAGPVVTNPSSVVKASVIDESSLVLQQKGKSVSVAVKAPKAEAVRAQLAGVESDLAPQPDSGVWSGSIPYDPNTLSSNGEQLTLVASGADKHLETKAIALVAPVSKTQQLYIFNEGTERFTTFFGGLLKVGNLNDKVRMIYLAFSVFLAAGILVYLFALKLHIRHLSLVSHSIAVVVLAVFLLVV